MFHVEHLEMKPINKLNKAVYMFHVGQYCKTNKYWTL